MSRRSRLHPAHLQAAGPLAPEPVREEAGPMWQGQTPASCFLPCDRVMRPRASQPVTGGTALGLQVPDLQGAVLLHPWPSLLTALPAVSTETLSTGANFGHQLPHWV